MWVILGESLSEAIAIVMLLSRIKWKPLYCRNVRFKYLIVVLLNAIGRESAIGITIMFSIDDEIWLGFEEAGSFKDISVSCELQ